MPLKVKKRKKKKITKIACPKKKMESS